MARTKSPLLIRLEYYPIAAFIALLRRLPLSLAALFCRSILTIVVALLPKRRRIMEQNLALVFPKKSAAARATIARKSLDTLARSAAVFAHERDLLTTDGAKRLISLDGFEHLDRALEKGKGAITFTAHYGCWEIMAGYVCTRYPKIAMVVRPLDNPMLNDLVTAIRASGSGGVIPHKQVLKEGIRLLRGNGILGILIDQNFYKGGLFVDFFGRPAATTSIVSVLARRTGCAVLPMHNRWENGRLKIYCEPAVTLSTNPDNEKAIVEDTQKTTKIVEGWIRETPEQWLWLHNRWKRQPEHGELAI